MGIVDNVCSLDLAPCEYRLTLYGTECVYVEGVRCVKSFSFDQVLLGMKSSCVRISGDRLRIEKFCGGDVVVKGRVACIERITL